MKCPKCGYDNPSAAQFCQECGAPLTPSRVKRPRTTRPLPPALIAQRASQLPVTRPLPEALRPFAPLPEGALLHHDRYAVTELRATSERQNIYLAEELVPTRVCPNCGNGVSDPEEQFCPSCGTAISEVKPVHLSYRIKESIEEHAFAIEARLLEMGLSHPNLLLPQEFFIEAPYGPPRRYLVETEFPPPLATSLRVPQEWPQVLEWGIGLAQGLAYLHNRSVALGEVSLRNVAIKGRQALWTNLDAAVIISQPSSVTAAEHFSRDVQSLAALLLFLATGQQHTAALLKAPEQAAAVLSQALTVPPGLTAAAFAGGLSTALDRIRRPGTLTFLVGYRTDVGQERSLNEDSLLVLDLVSVYRSVSVPVGLSVVADGMGGHEAGDLASQLTVQTIARHALEHIFARAAASEPLPDAGRWLTAAAQAANRVVHAQRQSAGTDMGSTLVMALLVGNVATIANVGDSRAYLLNGSGIHQITTDHSLVERLVATGQITQEEASRHPQRNVIYRVIGDRATVETDIFERRLSTGEALLLCSDGLSGMLPDKAIWEIWKTSTSPQEACDRLVQAANQAGGEDNITVIIVQLGN